MNDDDISDEEMAAFVAEIDDLMAEMNEICAGKDAAVVLSAACDLIINCASVTGWEIVKAAIEEVSEEIQNGYAGSGNTH